MVYTRVPDRLSNKIVALKILHAPFSNIWSLDYATLTFNRSFSSPLWGLLSWCHLVCLALVTDACKTPWACFTYSQHISSTNPLRDLYWPIGIQQNVYFLTLPTTVHSFLLTNIHWYCCCQYGILLHSFHDNWAICLTSELMQAYHFVKFGVILLTIPPISPVVHAVFNILFSHCLPHASSNGFEGYR